MKNRNTLVAALAGALVGITVGAGTYYSAQLVSYRYSDVEGSRQQYHRSENSPTDRASIRTIDARHAAASETVEDQCAHVSPRRKARCIESVENGIEYTGAQYDEN